MQYKWLNKEGNNKLIVFFNGWGMDEKIVSHLAFDGYDVLTFYDYRNIKSIYFDFSKYEKKYLIAWSMGVYICNYFYEKFYDFDKAIAINGTQTPIDDEYGIPSLIYNMTIDNFSELSCFKFMRKISSSIELKDYCSRNIEELKQELIEIKEIIIERFLSFDRAFISSKDRIFPVKNMFNFWNKKNVEIQEIDGFHYIFDMYNSWSDFL